ncbi:MAG: Gfo/Idh/MocA family oxidoreductase [Fimbriimonadaceae bacterium]|nr:Gfo/Idh/MocA family oxidoreductase [Fimbriimonadaceae bacterium]
MSDLRAALVGTGFIGPVHLEALRRLGIGVTGVLGSTPDKSAAAATAYGLPRGYADLDQLLADPAVDVVHLTTPNRWHYPQALAVLAAGKHVLCEKPLALTGQESAELVARAAAAGVGAGVCYHNRYYPLCLHARHLVRSGALGEVRAVVGGVEQDWLLRRSDYNWRVLADQGGDLRAVADIGTHWLDLVLSITGLDVSAVLADLLTVYPTRLRPRGEVETFRRDGASATEPVGITTDDCGSVLLRFTSGARGNLWVSQVTAGRKYRVGFEIIGSEQTLAWQSEAPNELWIGNREQGNRLLLRDASLFTPEVARFTDYPAGHNEGHPDSFKMLFRDFYTALAAGQTGAAAPYPTFADGHREIQFCDAVLESWRGEGWVLLPGR